MPTARKVAVKRTAAAKKTTAAKKTAAPRQNQTEKAVEAALKVYKSRVAAQVRHYSDTGDLCDEEYKSIRSALDLETELESKDLFRLQLDIRGIFETEDGCGYALDHEDGIQRAIVNFLEGGFTVPCVGGAMTVKIVDTNVYDFSIQEWD